MTWDIRVIEGENRFHVHHDGPKDEAKRRARRMAERFFPQEDGYRYRQSNDCVMVFKAGKHHADIAVEPLEHAPVDECTDTQA